MKIEEYNPNLEGYVKCPYCSKYILRDNVDHYCFTIMRSVSWKQKNQMKKAQETTYVQYILHRKTMKAKDE